MDIFLCFTLISIHYIYVVSTHMFICLALTHARVGSFLGETQVRATDLSKMSSDISGTRARSEEKSHILQQYLQVDK